MPRWWGSVDTQEVKEGLSEEVTSDEDLNKNKEPPM